RLTIRAATATSAATTAAATTTAGDTLCAHAERLAVIRVGGDSVRHTVRDRARIVDEPHPQERTRHRAATGRAHRHAVREAVVDRELRRADSTDVHAAVLHEPLDVLESFPAQARSHVVCRVDLADVRREWRRLPWNRVAPHRHAFDDPPTRAATRT